MHNYHINKLKKTNKSVIGTKITRILEKNQLLFLQQKQLNLQNLISGTTFILFFTGLNSVHSVCSQTRITYVNAKETFTTTLLLWRTRTSQERNTLATTKRMLRQSLLNWRNKLTDWHQLQQINGNTPMLSSSNTKCSALPNQ